MVWAFRAVIWAVLLIVGFRGVTGDRGGAAADRLGGTCASASGATTAFPCSSPRHTRCSSVMST